MNRIDLSHTIEDGLVTYKGLPAPIICDYISRKNSREMYDHGTEFQIGKIEMVSNTGTYIDCPFHRYEDGKDLSEVMLDKFVGLPAIKVSFNYKEFGLAIEKQHFEKIDLVGKAVLIHTGWSKLWKTDQYFEKHPFVTETCAKYLRDQGVTLVGIDAYNIDDTRVKSRPAHSILLAEEILIVEHLTNLIKLPKKNFTFTAIPPKIKGIGTFPVRAFAEFY